ncbi:MAG TPA: LysE family transporter [Methanomicrobiales archaeon]|nr:LysE family transporter [Methanomicrobiales archaeon]
MNSVFLASLAIGFTGAVAPGPMAAYIIGAARDRPLSSASLLVLGHGVLEVFMVAAIALGVESVPHMDWIAAIGSAVLFVLGFQQYRSTGDMRASSHVDRSPLIYGLAATLSNPYWWIWWLTFGAGFLAVNPSFSEFYLGHISADLVWFAVLALLVAQGAGLLGRHYKKVVKASGIAMMLFALYFAASIFWV